MAQRKLQSEIDRTLKKVTEGVELFESIFEKMNASTNATQKEKCETDLKTQIKKLQRLRDQIKTWISSSEIKDKNSLTETRKLIETQMERFKALEKEMKTKAFSKEGLIQAAKLDPAEKAKMDTINWLSSMIDELARQIEQSEAEIEILAASQGRKKKGSGGERVGELEHLNERRKWHVGRMELVQRMLDNGGITVDKVDATQEDIKYFVESNQEEDFEEDEGIYDELELTEDDDMYGAGDDLVSSHESEPIEEPVRSSKPKPHHQDDDSSMSSGVTKDRKHSQDEHTIPTPKKTPSKKPTLDSKPAEPVPPIPSPNFAKQPMSSALKTGLPVTPSPPTSSTQPTSTTAAPSFTGPRPATNAVPLPAIRYAAAAAAAVASPSSVESPTVTKSVPANATLPSPVLTSATPAHPPTTNSSTFAPTAAPSVSTPTNASAPAAAVTPSASIQAQSSAPTSAPASSVSAPSPSLGMSTVLSPQSINQSTIEWSGEEKSGGGDQSARQAQTVGTSDTAASYPSSSQTPAQASSTLQPPSAYPTDQSAPNSSGQVHTSPLSGLTSPQMGSPLNIQAQVQRGSGAGPVGPPPMLGQQQPGQTQPLAQQPVGSGSRGENRLPNALADLVSSFETAKQRSASRNGNIDQMHSALEAGLHALPHPQDAEKPRYYVPKNPYQTPLYYPQEPFVGFQDKTIYSKMDLDTLFYIFYYHANTYEQWLAAQELKRQSWRFHKQYLTWFQRLSQPQAITEDYEQGMYIYFDWESSWVQRKKADFRFEYRWLEEY
ncbi:CCR4-NOT transcriptional regulation complex, NOT5 subunit [Phaffia rhodozyma]|uniref:General negative regulator of transcription subunit n=1 Tax=Phaffia rhodozyma TaxID=264483 RepID=A0A0F7SXK6_PHARH|nr:CCR4-NOT transcriptional regulation complex, NOT5 subunit [Phaffia rhodozyma]